MGSAQLEFIDAEETVTPHPVAPASALRQQVAERLAAHKQRRRTAGTVETAGAAAAEKPLSPRHRAAAAVAERFAHTPSYRAALAEQAKRAIQEAAAAAEVALRNAEAVAAAQGELLGELALRNTPQQFTPATAKTIHSAFTITASSVAPTIRLYQDLPQVPAAPALQPAPLRPSDEEVLALEAEIAFRQSPVFDHFAPDTDPLTLLDTNLLEFPRQLVATRKARPRLAEGPLREDLTPRTAQLRIFEVEPEQISTAPAPIPAAPEWTSMIHLDAHKVTDIAAAPHAAQTPMLASLLPPQTAPLGLRSMAAVVDGILVAGCALACIAIYARLGNQIVLDATAAIEAAALLVTLHVIYQLLFFTLSDQTPGMRYARIGLCTFTDDNPTRSAMRKRILAQFIALCPLGLGVVWILFDDDGLGWHDRISQMYQRSY